MNLAELVSLGETMHRELGREYYLTGAGLKTDPAFQAIYDRFLAITTDEALALAQESGIPTLLEWVVHLRVGRAVALYEERQLTWEQNTVLRVDGREVPYLGAPIELQNTRDRMARIRLDRERARVGAAGLNGIRADRFHEEHRVVADLELGSDYVAAIRALAEIDLDALGRAVEAFLRATGDLYRDALTRLVRRRLGVPVAELVRADAAWAFRADSFDAAFPPERLLPTAMRQMTEIGLDATQQGRVRFDTDERVTKQPRAFCAPVMVPQEVYLVLRPSGGHSDYRTFWHELGHAMHFAATDPERPFQDRWLGDNSVTEGFAMLWDHLTIDAGWLRRYSGLSPADTTALRFELGVQELYMLRRYSAKLGYELELHRSDLGTGIAERYAERLTEATLFRFPEEDYLRDVDPGFYAARYLRAWQLEAALAETLTERFDEDWFRNPRAGAYVQGLWQRGQADPAHRLGEEVTGRPLGFEATIRRLEAILV